MQRGSLEEGLNEMTYTATYDPADDKLRISASGRLDAETYARVKAAGYGWAPKQGVFYAVWSPSREDLALELAGEIDDEDTTLVERAEQRAERFEGYQERRAEDATRARDAVAAIADGIPLGQPILIGHHSERHARRDAEKIENGMRRAVKMWDTAQYWQSRAKGALMHAKYKELPAVRARRIKTIEAEIRSLIADYTPAYSDQPAIMQVRWNWEPSSKDLTDEQREAERIAARVPHVYVGPKGRGGRWVPAESLGRIKEGNARSIAHLENRLMYEKAMLDEVGASDLLKPKPRLKQLPICNYRAPEGIKTENIYHRSEMVLYPQVEMTSAQYAAINGDYKGTRVVEGSHRVRVAMVRHSSVSVFLPDSKVHDKPAPVDRTAAIEELADSRPVPTYRAPEPPTEFDAMKDALRSGVAVQVVSAPQLFPTPAELAARMVEAAGIESGMCVLEPSAGTGAIVRAVLDSVDTEVLAYEINQQLCAQLSRTFPGHKAQVRCNDFLQVTDFIGCYPRVLMNPPFANGADIKHIQHAVKFLAPGGRLVAICANGPRQREQLMPLAENSGGYWEDLPAGTFAEQGTGVNTAMLVIEG